MHILRAILIDDEFASCEVLQYEINKLMCDIDVIGMYDNSLSGLKAIKSTKPDIVFLDIEMPNLNGFELLDLLGDYEDIHIVFVTAYNEYAVKAFRYYAIDYLLKPVESVLLKSTLVKIKNESRKVTPSEVKAISKLIKNEEEFSNRIVIPISNGFEMIDISEIIRCDADNNYTTIRLVEKRKVLVSKPLKHFEEILKHNGFLRVHQSHLINPNQLKKYIKSEGGYIVMNDDSIVKVSRSMKREVNDLFKKLSI